MLIFRVAIAIHAFTMANTFDPRKFYRVSKAIVMPSLWNESFGLVAAEAMAQRDSRAGEQPRGTARDAGAEKRGTGTSGGWFFGCL